MSAMRSSVDAFEFRPKVDEQLIFNFFPHSNELD